jgi:hypothetical protein
MADEGSSTVSLCALDKSLLAPIYAVFEIENPIYGARPLLSRIDCGAYFASKVLHQSKLNHYLAVYAE